MLFNSNIFIFVFLSIVFATYYLLLNFKNKNISPKSFLSLPTYIFTAIGMVKYLPIILSSIAVNFTLATILNRLQRLAFKRTVLTLGILFNIGPLGYYKYYDFFMTNINTVFKTDIALLNLAGSSILKVFQYRKIVLVRPCIIPQMTKVHPAPCHIQLTKKMKKKIEISSYLTLLTKMFGIHAFHFPAGISAQLNEWLGIHFYPLPIILI